MAAIRRHHPSAHITLLTTAGLAEIGRKSGWFDRVEIDSRPRWHDLPGWLRLRRFLRNGAFDRVYDLQSQDRTALYFKLFWPSARPEWSGIAPGASHPHLDPARRHMHAEDIHKAQLAIAGIPDIVPADLGWLDDSAVETLGLPARTLLLVPGSAPHRPDKRWPAERYALLAERAAARELTPVVLGSAGERPLAQTILAHCPSAIDLTGRTTLFAIAGLARRAVAAVGNDTGPMHIAAAVGCPAIVLFSAASNPVRAAPRGPNATVIQRSELADLSVHEVMDALEQASRL